MNVALNERKLRRSSATYGGFVFSIEGVMPGVANLTGNSFIRYVIGEMEVLSRQGIRAKVVSLAGWVREQWAEIHSDPSRPVLYEKWRRHIAQALDGRLQAEPKKWDKLMMAVLNRRGRGAFEHPPGAIVESVNEALTLQTVTAHSRVFFDPL